MSDVDRDLLAVQEDAILLDLVATREDLSAFADDPVAGLLGAFANDVDLGLETLPVAHLLAQALPVAAPVRGRRRSARMIVAAGTAIALVGTSGVAAAVTGDPLLPFRKAVEAVTGIGAAPTATSNGQRAEELPDPAATEAKINKSLNAFGQAIAQGDLEEAQRLLDIARGDAASAPDLAPGLEHRLDQLQDKIDRGVLHLAPGSNPSGQNGDDKNPSGQNPQDPDEAAKNDGAGQPKSPDSTGSPSGKGGSSKGRTDKSQPDTDQPSGPGANAHQGSSQK